MANCLYIANVLFTLSVFKFAEGDILLGLVFFIFSVISLVAANIGKDEK